MKLAELAVQKQKEYQDMIILARVNGVLTEINDMELDPAKDEVTFVTTGTITGNKTYRRSIVLLMLSAFYKTAPAGKLHRICVEYSVSQGYYCTVRADFAVTPQFLQRVSAKMHEMAEADLPITKKTISTAAARKLFRDAGMEDKDRLFRFRRSSFVNIYDLDGYQDYFYGYMAHSTGILRYFELYPYNDGFVLQMPRHRNPNSVPAFEPQEKVFQALKESTLWADKLGLDTVASLNEHIAAGEMNTLILVQEALQEQKTVEIVKDIQSRKDVRFVMIAGPSSSGKTTFANRLCIQLSANGMHPHLISVDNYFVERSETPRDANGNYNFEDLDSIDVELFNKQMNQLLRGETVSLPTFNFLIGSKQYGDNILQMKEEDILVIEGIHCLNDKLSYTLPEESKYKIYISALTQLNVDEHNRVSTTDGRLIRRLARDYRTRGASAKNTLSMWESVKRGEEKNIFPYQEMSDVVFNSAMAYELSVLKPYVEPLLFSIREEEPEFQEAKRLLKFLDYFLPCTTDTIPVDSILREFVGGGCFRV